MDVKPLYQLFIKCKGICTDTRKITGGEMFFALKGPNFNANQLAMAALESGCAYAVVDEVMEGADSGRLIHVEDVLTTMQQLANFHRLQFDIPVIGITGSNGKTTNKELINAVLSKQYNVLCTKGNLNNHIGVPLTLFELNVTHELAIVEMGANHVGEIKQLCEIAAPTHGLITSIGIAHLEGFGSVEGIRKGKKELFDYILKNDGICFVNQNADDIPGLYEGTKENAFYYGKPDQPPYATIDPSNTTLNLTIHTDQSTLKVRSNLIGDFHLNNILNAFAIGQFFEEDASDIVNAIESYDPKNNRSQRMDWNNNQVILDAYNANPTSMAAAVRSFISNDAKHKVAVLGDMLELGRDSQKYHQAIADQLKQYPFDQVILVGEEFKQTEVPDQYVKFDNTISAKAYVLDQQFQHKTILVKGSRSIGLEKIFD